MKRVSIPQKLFSRYGLWKIDMPFMRSLLVLLFLLMCVVAPAQLGAQKPERGGADDSGVGLERRDSNKVAEHIFSPPDSLKISIYGSQKPEEHRFYPDSLLGHDLHQPDPIRRQLLDYSYLGSLGTPARPTFLEVKERRGLNMGFHQFDLYDRPVDSIRYFKVNRTFTDVSYAQGGTKNDFIVKALFTRNLKPQWNFTADYQRISHVGFYTHQKSRHTAFTMNSSFQHKKKRYRGFASYSYNDFQQEDNGGITTDSLFDVDFYSDRTNIPVFLNTAKTRNDGHILSYTHYYELLKPKQDSLGQKEGRHLTLGHQLYVAPEKYKFFDKNLEEDSTYYEHLQIDDRGLRHFLKWTTIENIFKVSTFKNEKNKLQPRDLLSFGITQQFQKIKQEPIDTSYYALFVFGQWDYRPTSFLKINSYAHYGIGGATNEYLIKGELEINLSKLGAIHARILNQRFSPDLLQERLFISKREIYNNDFKKPITTSLHASYHLPVTKTKIHAKYHLLTNYIYYDTLGYAQQAEPTLNILQLILEQGFKFGIMGMENTFALQTANDDFIRAPRLMTKNSLFFEGRIFKKVMLARIGFDFRLNTSYYADGYQPVIGQFHLQDKELLGWYPALDLFFNFKVQTFRGFAKLENMSHWFTKRRYYSTPGYPMPEAHFRFGVTWRFID